MVMLLYTHPLNAEREARSAAGEFVPAVAAVCPQRSAAEPPQADERLRAPALNDDWAASARAWETLDEGPLTELLKRAEQAGRCG
ncbi:MAG: hypothetical protein IPG77_08235 [Betaproteobacteria bacterium]|nr:hypothetical protein [Betaproteobacteria bacterium]